MKRDGKKGQRKQIWKKKTKKKEIKTKGVKVRHRETKRHGKGRGKIRRRGKEETGV